MSESRGEKASPSGGSSIRSPHDPLQIVFLDRIRFGATESQIARRTDIDEDPVLVDELKDAVVDQGRGDPLLDTARLFIGHALVAARRHQLQDRGIAEFVEFRVHRNFRPRCRPRR